MTATAPHRATALPNRFTHSLRSFVHPPTEQVLSSPHSVTSFPCEDTVRARSDKPSFTAFTKTSHDAYSWLSLRSRRCRSLSEAFTLFTPRFVLPAHGSLRSPFAFRGLPTVVLAPLTSARQGGGREQRGANRARRDQRERLEQRTANTARTTERSPRRRTA